MSTHADSFSPDPPQRPARLSPPAFRAPNRSAVIAMRLFILSLGVLFFASMMAYVAIRTGLFGRQTTPLGTIELPMSLWISTFLVLAGSVTVQQAVAAVRRERQRQLRGWLAVTLLLAVAFVAVQTPALTGLISTHLDQLRAAGGVGRPMALYGAIFFLIVLHALHVVGGIVTLAWVTWRASRGAYDHEHYLPVRHTALYWHFLDVVWLVMYGTLWFLG